MTHPSDEIERRRTVGQPVAAARAWAGWTMPVEGVCQSRSESTSVGGNKSTSTAKKFFNAAAQLRSHARGVLTSGDPVARLIVL
jgi:hypothetical protein